MTELLVYDNGLNLPSSSDPECLAVQAYLAFINLKHIKTITLKGMGQIRALYVAKKLPALISRENNKTTTLEGAYDIIRNLKQKASLNVDDFITDAKQSAQVEATSSMLLNELMPCVLCYWWRVKENVNNNTYFQFAKKNTLLAKFLAPYIVYRSRDKYITNKLGENITILEAYRKAKSILTALNQLLGNKRFLFSDEKYVYIISNMCRPSSADAICFSCIASLLYPKFADEEMGKSLLAQFPSLVKYCDYIADKYFHETAVKSSSVGEYAQVESSLRKKDAEKELQAQSNVMFAGIGLAAIGLCYFLYNYNPITNILMRHLEKLNTFESIEIKV